MTREAKIDQLMAVAYRTLRAVEGPLIVAEGLRGVGAGELVLVAGSMGDRRGQVLEIDGDRVVVQVFEGTDGLDLEDTRITPLGEPMHLAVSPAMLGRAFDGQGRPSDGAPAPPGEARRDVNGVPMNVAARRSPHDFIETGISAIDGLNSLVRGQKLPIFYVSGAPSLDLALDITLGARLADESSFAVVFAGIGLTAREAANVQARVAASATPHRTALFINQSADPAIERLMTPRLALTLAEHLAFSYDMHVVVVLVDMTNYSEALREVAAARGDVAGRRGYPGFMYTDLASIYERTGQLADRPGSITQLPILTMPDDDITHPIPDLTGYVTEGQIVLSRDLSRRGVQPPIDVLPSLSRLMNQGIGEGQTLPLHRELADQVYAAYARGIDVRQLASILGEASLLDEDLALLQFADAFEAEFIGQPEGRRTIETTLRTGWRLLGALPRTSLSRISADTFAEATERFGPHREQT